MDPNGRDPETDLTGLEKTLAGLRPSTVALGRDRLLFEAGRASALAESRGRLGTAMAAMFALVAVGLGGLLIRERAARSDLESRLASLTAPAASVIPPTLATLDPGPPDRVSPDSYVILSRRILAGGSDILPSGPPGVVSEHPMPASAPLRVRSPGRLLDL